MGGNANPAGGDGGARQAVRNCDDDGPATNSLAIYDGQTALGVVCTDGRSFVAIDTAGVVIGKYESLIEATRAFPGEPAAGGAMTDSSRSASKPRGVRRTTLETALRGYDPAFERTLVDKIIETIALTSITTDQNVLALRTGETIAALATVMSFALALRPDMAVPNKLREMVEALARRIKRDAAKAIVEGQTADAQRGHA
jgi:hypothetical protein